MYFCFPCSKFCVAAALCCIKLCVMLCYWDKNMISYLATASNCRTSKSVTNRSIIPEPRCCCFFRHQHSRCPPGVPVTVGIVIFTAVVTIVTTSAAQRMRSAAVFYCSNTVITASCSRVASACPPGDQCARYIVSPHLAVVITVAITETNWEMSQPPSINIGVEMWVRVRLIRYHSTTHMCSFGVAPLETFWADILKYIID